jgi:hypothetical protein
MSDPLAEEFLNEHYDLCLFENEKFKVSEYVGSAQRNPYEDVSDFVTDHDELMGYLSGDIGKLYGITISEYMKTTRYERNLLHAVGNEYNKKREKMLDELRRVQDGEN